MTEKRKEWIELICRNPWNTLGMICVDLQFWDEETHYYPDLKPISESIGDPHIGTSPSKHEVGWSVAQVKPTGTSKMLTFRDLKITTIATTTTKNEEIWPVLKSNNENKHLFRQPWRKKTKQRNKKPTKLSTRTSILQ